MPAMLVTGGTVFVSRAVAAHFAAKGWDVFVLNRGSRPQPEGTTLIRADRHALGECLRGRRFDAVIDTAYTADDVTQLLSALDSCGEYVLISSSAVYPDDAPQPFREETPLGANRWWGRYGTDKIAAEQALLQARPDAFVLRPPYLYGPMNNVYRETFVFDCALAGRPFYLPGEGEMKLQFFHVEDLCRFIDVLLKQKPRQRVFNLGNRETVTVRAWVEACYRAAGRAAEFRCVKGNVEQRNYFSFYSYEYCLDVSRQHELMPDLRPLQQGLQEAFAWYVQNSDQVIKKPYWTYIDQHFA